MANGDSKDGAGLLGTTAVSMTAATFAPTVKWALMGFPAAQMPESTPLLIAATGLVLFHAGEQALSALYAAWLERLRAKREAALLPKPPVSPAAGEASQETHT